jgi:hypothetical protein
LRLHRSLTVAALTDRSLTVAALIGGWVYG